MVVYWNASDQDYDEATEVAASVIIQWGIAMGRAHKEAVTYIVLSGSAGHSILDTYIPVLPKTASEIAKGGPGASEVTTIVSRTSSILKKAGLKSTGHMFRQLARSAKTTPVLTGVKVTGTALLAAEAGVSVYAGIQAYKSGGIHTYADGTTYDPTGLNNWTGYSNSNYSSCQAPIFVKLPFLVPL